MTVLETAGFDLAKTRDLAALLFGSPKAAKTGPARSSCTPRASRTVPARRSSAIGRNLQRVAVTHTGALDVKDVLGYARLVLTPAALEQLSSALLQERERSVMEARDVIVAPADHREIDDRHGRQQYTFEVHPRATKTQIRHAVEEIFKVDVIKVNTINVAARRRTSRAAASARRASSPTGKKPSSPSSPAKKSSWAA